MISIDILEDEALQTAVNRIISGMLPHEGYQPELYTDLLFSVYKYIKPEEFEGEYYILFQMLEKHCSIKQRIKTYIPKLDREMLEANLFASLDTLVLSENVNTEKLLNMEGLDTDIEIEENFDTARELISHRVFELYDSCFKLGIGSSDSLGYLPALEGEFIEHMAKQSIQTQVEIINQGKKVGRQKYLGSSGWLKYMNVLNMEVANRLEEEDNNILDISKPGTISALLDKARSNAQPLANYGIPPLDDETPMLKHRLVILTAQEGTGKTTLSIEWMVNLILQGKSVLYMSGENTAERLMPKILSNYIYKKYGFKLSTSEIINSEKLPPNLVRLINVCTLEIEDAGLLRIVKELSYDNLYQELQSEYDKKPFDSVMLDHSYSLVGGADWYDRIGKLAVASRKFKNDYPVYILILSHLSTEAKKFLAANRKVESSPTKGNSSLSGEADEILILSRNESLAKQEKILMQVYKRRDAKIIASHLVLKTKFEVCSFIWDDKYQTISSEEAQEIANIEDVYNIIGAVTEEDDEDGEYLDHL